MYFGEGQGSYKIALLFKLSLVVRHIISGIISLFQCLLSTILV